MSTEPFILPARLREGVHLVRIGPDVVLLDTTADAYACLLDAVRPAGASGGEDADLLHELDAAGFLSSAHASPSPDTGAAPRSAPPPARATGLDSAVVATPADRLDFVRTTLRMATDYHGRSLAHLLMLARRRPAAPASPEAAARRSALFTRWAPWIPFQGACLYRAFFLLNFLRREGLGAHWVFGVRTWPFGAHCWLQAGDLVLDDDLDRVRRYTPILVV